MKYFCNQPPRYKCGYCAHKAHQTADIKRHIGRIHKGSTVQVIELYDPKNEVCEYVCPNANCSKKYKYKRGLNAHLNYECGKPGLKCSYCDFKNSYRHVMKSHWTKEHPDREFSFEDTGD